MYKICYLWSSKSRLLSGKMRVQIIRPDIIGGTPNWCHPLISYLKKVMHTASKKFKTFYKITKTHQSIGYAQDLRW